MAGSDFLSNLFCVSKTAFIETDKSKHLFAEKAPSYYKEGAFLGIRRAYAMLARIDSMARCNRSNSPSRTVICVFASAGLP